MLKHIVEASLFLCHCTATGGSDGLALMGQSSSNFWFLYQNSISLFILSGYTTPGIVNGAIELIFTRYLFSYTQYIIPALVYMCFHEIDLFVWTASTTAKIHFSTASIITSVDSSSFIFSLCNCCLLPQSV